MGLHSGKQRATLRSPTVSNWQSFVLYVPACITNMSADSRSNHARIQTNVFALRQKRSVAKTFAVAAFSGVLGAVFQLAIILGFQACPSSSALYHNIMGSCTPQIGTKVHTPHSFLLFMAIVSAFGLALGVLQEYWDLYAHCCVRGIKFWFVALDAAGNLTSLISVRESLLCARCQGTGKARTPNRAIFFAVIIYSVDIAGAMIYSVKLALWMGLMIDGVAYNLRQWLGYRKTLED